MCEDKAEIGCAAPDFALLAGDGHSWRLSDQLGRVVVLLFYPQNETLTCTRQLCSVRDHWENYLETRATVVGISPGTPAEHRIFAESRRLPIPLLADPDRQITGQYAKHWALPIGLTRAVVVIDARGIVRSRDIMLRAFRPSDAKIITNIYAARGDAFDDEYEQLKNRKIRTQS